MTELATKALLRLAEAISWLDRWRWAGEQPENVALRIVPEAAAQDRILTHWIAYVTDRMRLWEDVWYRGALILSRMATDYSSEKPALEDVDVFLERYRETSPDYKMRAWKIPGSTEGGYRCRFPDDDVSIYRTLRILTHMEWSLVNFLGRAARDLRADRQGLRKIAHRLDILTYRLDLPEDRAIGLLTNESALNRDFEAWTRRATEGKKRLWAALRDYRKPGTMWNAYLSQCGLTWPRDNFELWQLELPGDVWNSRFFEQLVRPLAEAAGISTKGSSGTVARRICEAVRDNDPDSEFYPEQFDVSFDFGQRMCEPRSCWFCPFWKGRADLRLLRLSSANGSPATPVGCFS